MFEAQTQKARKERAISELEELGFPFAISFLGALQFESLVRAGFSLDRVYSTKNWPIWPMDSSKRLVAWCPKPNSTIIVLGLAKNVIKLETVSSTGVQAVQVEDPNGTERGFVVLIGESSYYIAKHSLIEAVAMHKVKTYKLAEDMPLHVDIQIP